MIFDYFWTKYIEQSRAVTSPKNKKTQKLLFTKFFWDDFGFRRGTKWWECTVNRRSRKYPNHWATKYQSKRTQKNGERGIRTLGTGFHLYTGLANRRTRPAMRPLHLILFADVDYTTIWNFAQPQKIRLQHKSNLILFTLKNNTTSQQGCLYD